MCAAKVHVLDLVISGYQARSGDPKGGVMNKVVGIVLGAAAWASPIAVHGDEIEDQLATALEYYQAGDVADAITELQYTISALQAIIAQGYEAIFPEPPSGWTANAVETEAGAAFMGGGTVLSRDYQTPDGGAVGAQLMVDNPMIQTFAAMMANPAMLAMQQSAERLKIGRDNAVVTFEEGGSTGEAILVLGGRVMLKLDGRGLDNREPLVELMQAFDIAQLKSTAGL